MTGSSREAALPHDCCALKRATDVPSRAGCALAHRNRRAFRGHSHAGGSYATAALLRRGRGRSADQVEEQERRGRRRSPRSASCKSKAGAIAGPAAGVVHSIASGARCRTRKPRCVSGFTVGWLWVGGENGTGSAIETARSARCRRMATPAANNALLQGWWMGEG